jgi:hypothetical protein
MDCTGVHFPESRLQLRIGTPNLSTSSNTTEFGDDLLFKRGTALSKLYFPETW